MVDEQGRLLNPKALVEEGHFVSIVDTSYYSYPFTVTDGKFDIITHHCCVASIWFYRTGYKNEFRSWASPNKVPKPLHIVLRKNAATSAPAAEPNAIGLYKVVNLDQKIYGAYSTLLLELKADGTAISTTTLPDGKTQINGYGNWSQSGETNARIIILSITETDSMSDPAHLTGHRITLSPMDRYDRLLRDSGGAPFVRLK